MAFRLVPQQQAQQPTGLAGIARNMVQPFVKTGRNIAGGAFELGRAGLSALGNKNAYVNQETGSEVQNPFLNRQELESFNSGKGPGLDNLFANLFTPGSGVQKQIQNSAGVASYAVPFGKGANVLTRAILPGAASGGLSAFSQDDASTENVLGGAVTGGVTAGILDKVLGGLLGGRIGKSLEETGSKVRKGVAPVELKPSIYGAANEAEIQATLDSLGIRGNATQKYAQLQPKVQELSDIIEPLLQQNPKLIKRDSVIDSLMKNLKSTIRSSDLNEKTAKKEINSYIAELLDSGGITIADEITLPDLFKVKKFANEDYGAVKRILDTGGTLSPKQKVIVQVRKTLDDIIGEASPEIKRLTKMQSNLYDAAPSLEKARSIPDPGFKIPFAGNQVTIPGGRRMQDATGSLLQSAGQKMGGGSPVVSPELSSLLTQAGSRVATNMPNGQSQSPIPTPTSSSLTQPPDTVPTSTGGATGVDQDSLSKLLALGVATGKVSPAQVSALEALGYLPGKKSAAADKAQRQLNQAVPTITRIASVALEAPGGLAGTLAATAGNIPGVEGGAAEFLDQDTEGLATQLAKAFAGETGVATDRDIKRWKAILPAPKDTVNERKRKLREMANAVISGSEANDLEVPPEIYQLQGL